MTSDELIRSRQNRLRKLLPELQLQYPDDAVIRHLADLIGTTDPAFSDSIRSIILDAHLNDAVQRNASDVEVMTLLAKVKSRAVGLQQILSGVDVSSKDSSYLAGFRLELELDAQQANGSPDLIPEYISSLKTLIAVADAAVKRVKPKRGPRGAAGGNPAFDRFMESLVMTARQRNFNLTIYRRADEVWQGTLLEVAMALKPYLPSKFFPNAELGRAIEHIRSKLIRYITKNTPSSG